MFGRSGDSTPSLSSHASGARDFQKQGAAAAGLGFVFASSLAEPQASRIITRPIAMGRLVTNDPAGGLDKYPLGRPPASVRIQIKPQPSPVWSGERVSSAWGRVVESMM